MSHYVVQISFFFKIPGLTLIKKISSVLKCSSIISDDKVFLIRVHNRYKIGTNFLEFLSFTLGIKKFFSLTSTIGTLVPSSLKNGDFM